MCRCTCSPVGPADAEWTTSICITASDSGAIDPCSVTGYVWRRSRERQHDTASPVSQSWFGGPVYGARSWAHLPQIKVSIIEARQEAEMAMAEARAEWEKNSRADMVRAETAHAEAREAWAKATRAERAWWKWYV